MSLLIYFEGRKRKKEGRRKDGRKEEKSRTSFSPEQTRGEVQQVKNWRPSPLCTQCITLVYLLQKETKYCCVREN